MHIYIAIQFFSFFPSFNLIQYMYSIFYSFSLFFFLKKTLISNSLESSKKVITYNDCFSKKISSKKKLLINFNYLSNC